MALIVPFRALRPTRSSAARVAAVPYDVVSTEEAQRLASGNPFSFLHVSRAEIDLPPGTPPYDATVYAKAVENFSRLRADAPLVMEDVPSLYVYRLRMADHAQTGVAACFSLDEYDRNAIKKHERTRRDKEDDRTRHILELRAQTGPVFLIYRASDAVNAVVARTTASAPLFDFAAEDGVQHTVWRVAPDDSAALIAAFAGIRALYIADGHHRAASASRVRQHLRGPSGASGDWDTFLAVAFPDNQVQVLPYNRMVKDLDSQTPDSLLARLRDQFTVKDGSPKPERRGEVTMFLADRWHTIVLGAPAGGSPAGRLDVSVLQDRVLMPLLRVGYVRTDTRIDFVGGARGTSELEKLVTSGKAAVAFSLYPVSVDDLIAISDAGGIMPPKSTWFEPKLRDGLLSHVI